MFSDTMESSIKLHLGNRYAQIFATRFGWTRAFPMKTKSEAHKALSLLFARDGVPTKLVTDGSKEQTKGEFRRKCRESSCATKTTKPFSPWQNVAESAICELKRGVARKMVKSRAPKQLWDDCLELESLIRSNTAHTIYELQGQVPEMIVASETSDISPFCELEWYEWVKFRDTQVPFPNDKEVLGRYLGPSVDIGPAMCIKILKSKGQVVYQSTYRALTPEEKESCVEQEQMQLFDRMIAEKFADPGSALLDDVALDAVEAPTYKLYEDDDGKKGVRAGDDYDEIVESYDQYVGGQVNLPEGNVYVAGQVKRWKRGADGLLIGCAHTNPILDTRVYEVEMPDGGVVEYAANVIAECIYAQYDAEANQFLMLEAIEDHKCTDDVMHADELYVEINGKQHICKSTRGWLLSVQSKDGSSSWEMLADVKESYPVQCAEYAVARRIDKEPAFVWWVPYTLKKCDHIIAAVTTQYHNRTHKYGF
jgi:hypothetical protein